MIGLTRQGLSIGLRPGEVFAGYTIIRLLGCGGMGEVYLAEHPRLPRQEALKVLSGDISADDEYRRRFVREADLAAALWHPNIVRVNDRGEFDGKLWISMDFVDGTDAASLLRNRYPAGMPADRVVAIVEAIASALDYAHQHHNVMHRDVSPANILLSEPDEGSQRILLSDFGIARNIGDTSSGLTATNMMIGTFPYAAPEQLTDEPLDHRADQYALAATAYHLLTGSQLFPHDNPAVVISRHLSAPPPLLAETHPLLAPFDSALATALAKDPTDRYSRCTAFAQAFARAARAGQSATSVCTMPRPAAVRPQRRSVTETEAHGTKPHPRRWRIFAAAATVIALTGIAASGYPLDDRSEVSPRALAQAAEQPDFASEVSPPPLPPAAPAPPVAAPANEAVALPSTPSIPAPTSPPAPRRAPVPAAASAAPPAPAKAPEPAPQRPPDPDQAFVNMVSGIPGLTVTDPGTAAATGRAVCNSLQNGGTPNDSVQATVTGNDGVTPAQAAAGVNAAITVYCPQYQQ
ncbi:MULTISPECIES: serine/threonine-protein kinase [Mycobacterium]|jgi:serine/threonine-protein kinase|uniref:non-specific serine/threonine protein kinase n=1 Tax=Mycobacterium gordonae TaxID=1778 RepID=A0A1A6BB88_MYCGO|nr:MULTISPECIES: serine/threonine-protein kinase [Mycobacterium]MBI2698543.1 protein kinase [Mycobacterium sp.]MCQ4360373.1 serine/threonine-protein kinase [Mycobacterium gordonae]MCV7010586.1 protein kinase [Mycobacterium gordonae]OBR99545.1 protein kinase [Mycobacterium gordonae]ODR21630.1 protein kinase [Mycobacterium gordonae]